MAQLKVTPFNGGSAANAYAETNISSKIMKVYPINTLITLLIQKSAIDGSMWCQVADGFWLRGIDVEMDTSNYPKQPTTPIVPKSTAQEAKEEAESRAAYYAAVKAGYYLEENGSANYLNTMNYLKNLATSNSVAAKERIALTKFKYIHGAPFQFIDNTDPRYGKDQYGRMYAERIVANAPIAVFTPGVPRFNAAWTIGDKSKDTLLFALKKSDSNDSETEKVLKESLEKIGKFSEGAQYYYFFPMFREYVKYVNTMCRTSAHFAGIGDKQIYVREGVSVKAANYNFRNNAQDPENASHMRSMLGMDESVAFYFEPGSGVSESFGNTTSESALAGLNKGISDKAREAEQLLGAGAGVAIDTMDEANLESMILNNKDVSNWDKNSPIGRIKANAKISFLGANMRLPEIWRDSNYVKSYSIDIKFVSPYGTKFSKWYHVLCPFFALVGLGAPLAQTGNSYMAPFINRIYSKGYFNCEMAIIDSMTIKKFGDGDGVTEDGMPSEIEVSISFKDLYTAMALSAIDISPHQFLNNSGLIEFIGTTTGLNMNRAGTDAYVAFLTDTVVNMAKEFPGNWMYKTRDSLVRAMLDAPIIGSMMDLAKLNGK